MFFSDAVLRVDDFFLLLFFVVAATFFFVEVFFFAAVFFATVFFEFAVFLTVARFFETFFFKGLFLVDTRATPSTVFSYAVRKPADKPLVRSLREARKETFGGFSSL